jgi:cyclopropane-fatty-acyl-phospholipid synthase
LVLNQQCPKKSYEVSEKHYDIGNDLYECMLDKRMIYSCGFWKKASTFRRLFIKKLCQLKKI